MDLHNYIDLNYHPDGDAGLIERLADVEDINRRAGELDETLVHVAARRRRCSALQILHEHGADLNLRNAAGKTAFAHSIRRGFSDVVALLREFGVREDLNRADAFAVAVIEGDLASANQMLDETPGLANTGNNEEDRILADVAGRPQPERVRFLLDHGASLSATALDGGTALHQACWFGQPENARMLIAAGSDLEFFDSCHNSSPLGWAVHGSRFSGGAEEVQEKYAALVEQLLVAGSKLHYPNEPESDAYRERLMRDASAKIQSLLESANP